MKSYNRLDFSGVEFSAINQALIPGAMSEGYEGEGVGVVVGGAPPQPTLRDKLMGILNKKEQTSFHPQKSAETD